MFAGIMTDGCPFRYMRYRISEDRLGVMNVFLMSGHRKASACEGGLQRLPGNVSAIRPRAVVFLRRGLASQQVRMAVVAGLPSGQS